MPRIVAVPHMPDDATRAPVAAERLVHGQPLQAVANAYSSQDERFHCGVWEGGVGAWRGGDHGPEQRCHHQRGGDQPRTACDSRRVTHANAPPE